MGTRRDEHDPGRRFEVGEQPFHQGEVPEMIDAEGGFHPVLGAGPMGELQPGVAHQGVERREPGGGQFTGEAADRSQGGQVEDHRVGTDRCGGGLDPARVPTGDDHRQLRIGGQRTSALPSQPTGPTGDDHGAPGRRHVSQPATTFRHRAG